jgi:putative copper resistance protein D
MRRPRTPQASNAVSLLVDLFGYLGILLHGLVIVSQSMALGGALFLVLLARPFAAMIGADIADRTARIAAISAFCLVGVEAVNVAMQLAILTSTLDVPVGDIITANFAVAGIVKAAAAAVMGVLLLRGAAAGPLLAAGTVELVAATLTTHAAARLSDNALLLGVEFLHQLGAAIWVGGIPCFVMALARLQSGGAYRSVGGRFSRMSMAGVACILVSGMTMCMFYIGSWQAFYGTAYGVMVGAKISMFLMLLALGAGNFLVTERLRRDPATPVLRMRRFAEVEIGIGITIFFCAASLTSVPPGVDLTADRATWSDVVDRDFTPKWPTLSSPDHDRLGIPALQAQLDQEARARAQEPRAAFVEGSGELPPRNADDIAWSEYNHHWSGIFVFAIGVLALLNQAGLRWARQWPLVFLGLGAFLLVRSDPEVWPLGDIGLLESLRDVEVVQHRVFAALPIAFGLFEWGVRTGRIRAPWAAYIFPMICAGGGALLLTHSHAIANVKDQLLIEWTHTPLALAAIVAGWSRWLELRLPGRIARISAWVWPVCFVMIGLMLFFYREA